MLIFIPNTYRTIQGKTNKFCHLIKDYQEYDKQENIIHDDKKNK